MAFPKFPCPFCGDVDSYLIPPDSFKIPGQTNAFFTCFNCRKFVFIPAIFCTFYPWYDELTSLILPGNYQLSLF